MMGMAEDWIGCESPAEYAQRRLRWLWIGLDQLEDCLPGELNRLRALRAQEQWIEQRKGLLVWEARKAGQTWQAIADAMGITRQAAQKRWGKYDDPTY